MVFWTSIEIFAAIGLIVMLHNEKKLIAWEDKQIERIKSLLRK